MLIALVIGFFAALGVANMPEGGAATKLHSGIALGVGAAVTFISFIGLRTIFG